MGVVKRAVICGGAPVSMADLPAELPPYALCVCADAGLRAAQQLGIPPDFVVGDFDSLGSVPAEGNVVTYPAEKDDTDLMLAVKYAIAHGFKTICIFGCMGGRVDMSIATMQTLCYIINNGCTGYVFGENSVMTGIRNTRTFLGPGRKGIVSVFAYGGDAKGVTISGLKYNMENGTIFCDMPRGVSNEFVGTPASIEVTSGTLIIVTTNNGFRKETLGR